MEREAIQEIIKNANTGIVIDSVKNVETRSSLVALPDGFIIQDLEKYMPARDIFRAEMQTEVIDEFVRYNEEQAVSEESQCFIDVELMEAKSIFDIGTKDRPLHCRNKAFLELKKTAVFKELLEFDGVKHNQRFAAEWIEDHEEWIDVFDVDGQAMSIADVSRAIRELTVRKESGRTSKEDDFAAKQSEFESVAISTKEGLSMPAVLKFTCTPYNGLSDYCFELRHSVIDQGEKPYVNFRIKLLESRKEDMAKEFKEILDEELSGVIPVYLGSIRV